MSMVKKSYALDSFILKNSMNENLEREALLKSHEVLVLSTGYEPLFKTCWKRAISAVLSGRAEIIDRHETLWIGTSSGRMECPVTVRFVTGFIAAKISIDLSTKRPTKKALWHRDCGKCQYCQKIVTVSNATIDHVIPKSRGGQHTWENLVIACSKCNGKKANRLLTECNMKLQSVPHAPQGRFIPVIG